MIKGSNLLYIIKTEYHEILNYYTYYVIESSLKRMCDTMDDMAKALYNLITPQDLYLLPSYS